MARAHYSGMGAVPARIETELTGAVIGAALEVSNVLGAGFLEKVYERAIAAELRLRGIEVETQSRFPVWYKGDLVGDFSPDLVVAGELIVELKCADRLANQHMSQCLNYLRASSFRLALLFNFQHPKLEWKRLIL